MNTAILLFCASFNAQEPGSPPEPAKDKKAGQDDRQALEERVKKLEEELARLKLEASAREELDRVIQEGPASDEAMKRFAESLEATSNY